MAPAVDVKEAQKPSDGKVKSENAGSVKVLEELLQKLTLSKDAPAASAASSEIATFINGNIEEKDAPTA